jgi:hypothetical protein
MRKLSLLPLPRKEMNSYIPNQGKGPEVLSLKPQTFESGSHHGYLEGLATHNPLSVAAMLQAIRCRGLEGEPEVPTVRSRASRRRAAWQSNSSPRRNRVVLKTSYNVTPRMAVGDLHLPSRFHRALSPMLCNNVDLLRSEAQRLSERHYRTRVMTERTTR